MEAAQQFQSGISLSWMSSSSHMVRTEVMRLEEEAPFWEEHPG